MNAAEQQNYVSFWPEKSKMEKYGPVFSVHSVSRKHYTNIKQWEYKINKKVRTKGNSSGVEVEWSRKSCPAWVWAVGWQAIEEL